MVPIYNILPYIRSIAQKRATVKIPNDVETKFYSVLATRLQCMQWYAHNTKDDDEQAKRMNQSHQYPVQVLRQAIGTLRDAGMLPTAISAKHQSAVSTVNVPVGARQMCNTFSRLDLHDAEQKTYTGAVVAEPCGTPTTAPQLRTEQSLRSAEGTFIQMRLLEELEGFHDFLIKEWINCSLDGARLSAVALLSSQAMHLAYQIDQAAIDYELGASHAWRQPFFQSLKETEMGDIESDFFRIHGIILSCLRRETSDLKAASLRNMGQDSRWDYFGADQDTKAEIEKCVISQIIYTCRVQGRTRAADGVLPKLVAHLLAAESQNSEAWQVPDHVAFGMRLEVHARAIMGRRSATEYHVLTETLDRTDADKAFHLRMLENKNSMLHIQSDVARSMLRNLFKPTKKAQEIKSGTKEPNVCDQNAFILSSNWVSQGCHLFAFKYSGMSFGCMTTAISTTFYMLAHVYNMCKEERFADLEWHDFNLLLAVCGEDLLYRGARPTSKRRCEYKHRIMYSMGETAQALSTTLTNVERVESGSVAYIRLAGVCDVASKDITFAFWSRATPVSAALRDKSIRKSISYWEGAEDDELIVRATTVQKLLGRIPRKLRISNAGELENRSELIKLNNSTERLPALQVLRLTKEALDIELCILDFDWVEFNKACIYLVTLFRQAWRVNGWPRVYEWDEQPPWQFSTEIALYISQVMEKIDSRTETAIKLYNILKDFIAKKGSAGSNRIEKTKSKHLSTLKPSILAMLEHSVKKHGLLDDVFTPEQHEGLPAFSKTTLLEDKIRDLFGRGNKGRSGSPKKSKDA